MVAGRWEVRLFNPAGVPTRRYLYRGNADPNTVAEHSMRQPGDPPGLVESRMPGQRARPVREAARGNPPAETPAGRLGSTSRRQGRRPAALGPLGVHRAVELVYGACQARRCGNGRRRGAAGISWAVHDGWSPYWRYDQASHAMCAAHLLRELEAAAELPGQGWAAELAEWFAIACAQAAGARDTGADRLAPAVLAGLRDRYDRIATDRAANPLPSRPPTWRRRPRRSPAACLLERLEVHRDQVCRFLEDLRVPPTNNLAERDIRMVKLQQKISGCWRTLDGARTFPDRALLRGGRAQHGINPLAALRRLFEADPWLPAPAPPGTVTAMPVRSLRPGSMRGEQGGCDSSIPPALHGALHIQSTNGDRGWSAVVAG